MGLYGRIHANDKQYCCERSRMTENVSHDTTCKNFKPAWMMRDNKKVLVAK